MSISSYLEAFLSIWAALNVCLWIWDKHLQNIYSFLFLIFINFDIYIDINCQGLYSPNICIYILRRSVILLSVRIYILLWRSHRLNWLWISNFIRSIHILRSVILILYLYFVDVMLLHSRAYIVWFQIFWLTVKEKKINNGYLWNEQLIFLWYCLEKHRYIHSIILCWLFLSDNVKSLETQFVD